MDNTYPSQLLERAVAEFSKLPGIGRKTALRLVLDVLRRSEDDVDNFTSAVSRVRKEVKYCRVCHNISDTDVCPICSDTHSDATTICVVENIRDVMAVENTQQYRGLYHVLGGIISPMDGIGPNDIEIDSLVERVAHGGSSTVSVYVSLFCCHCCTVKYCASQSHLVSILQFVAHAYATCYHTHCHIIWCKLSRYIEVGCVALHCRA